MLKKKLHIIPIGVAMFSMFFGAGNVIFPLLIGAQAGDHAFFAILGFLIMGVGIPFCGLFAIILFNGDYRPFFSRIGAWPGFFTALVLLIALGPTVAMPRIIALSHSTLNLTSVPLTEFNLVACVALFFLTLKEKHVINILGYVLSPLLIIALLILITVGLIAPPEIAHTTQSSGALFMSGLDNGYNTMDLLAAFFFASMVYRLLKIRTEQKGYHDEKHLISTTFQASLIGAGLLAIVYIGFGTIAALHSQALQHVPMNQLIFATAQAVLGPYASLAASSVFALACLTTAMTLGVIVTQFIQLRVLRGRVPYWACLIFTYTATFFFANFGFDTLVKASNPVLSAIYPALIVLTLCNIAHKLWGFKWVKLPTFLTLAISILMAVI
tara:strand:+ start:17056 stop:18207 length:1152 start_codon:yes stop_codon:yes gene_type:complete